MLQHVGSNSARNPPYVIKSKVVGDESAPAVGAKFYGLVLGHWSLVFGRWSLVGSLWLLAMRCWPGPTTTDQGPFHTRLFNFFSSRYFTTFPTSWACSRVVIRSASSVSTTTR